MVTYCILIMYSTDFLCFFGVFCVLSRIFFNTAPRSPKVGKNVDKSLLIITVWSKFTESKPTLLFCAVYYNYILYFVVL